MAEEADRRTLFTAAIGPCTVIGYGVRTTPDFAAFANGTLAEALDFQDTNIIVLTHNGTPIIPAVLAPGEALQARWASVAAAMLAEQVPHVCRAADRERAQREGDRADRGTRRERSAGAAHGADRAAEAAGRTRGRPKRSR
ncbi:MAG: MmgE/PrpD family protein [Burkholderiales bacterium]